MKRKALLTCVLVSASALMTGCTTEQYARSVVEWDTSAGKTDYVLFWIPESEKLVENKTVSAARLYKMPDKVEIDVWVIRAETKGSPRGTVVILHDLGRSKLNRHGLAKTISQKGFDVVLTDFRAHGRSTGKHVTFGAKERYDQKRVVDELLEEKLITEPLYLLGAGMGGSVAIQHAAIDPRVKGVMAIAPFRDLRSFCRGLQPFMNPEDFDKMLARIGQIGKFKPDDVSALKDIPKLRCPVLMLHGKLDRRVHYSNSEDLYKAANQPKELQLIELFGHLGMLFAADATYVEGIEKVATGKVGEATKPAKKPAPAKKPKPAGK